MAVFGVLALVVAAIAAGWLLFGAARGAPKNGRTVPLLKAAAWFGLAGALFAAKLFPLALMILLAAGGVSAIEVWRERAVDASPDAPPSQPPARAGALTREEAASVLGVPATASAEEIKTAHRRLIAQLHPDRGGSDYLAAKINDARERLLRAGGR